MKRIAMLILFITMAMSTYAQNFLITKTVFYTDIPKTLRELHRQYNVIKWEIIPIQEGNKYFRIVLEIIEDDEQKY